MPTNDRKAFRRLVASIAFCALSSMFGPAIAQDGSSAAVGDRACSLAGIKSFERRYPNTHRITAKFMSKPDPQASERDVKRHYVFSLVLAKLAINQLNKSLHGQCTLEAEVDSLFNLHFELFSIGRTAHDECSLSRCIQSLAEQIRSLSLDAQTFSTAVQGQVAYVQKIDSLNFARPAESARRAVQEAFLHIYPEGGREHILSSVSEKDLRAVERDEFAAWMRSQQSALAAASEERSPPPERQVPPDSIETRQNSSGPCTTRPESLVQDLEIKHHGWGHRSIILIRNAFRTEGMAGITNPTLRAFCDRSQKGQVGVDPVLLREMAGPVSCTRTRMGSDRWLVIFSAREPVQTGAQMRNRAERIAQALKPDACSDPGLGIVIGHFLQQE
jgi:hypothetical protein